MQILGKKTPHCWTKILPNSHLHFSGSSLIVILFVFLLLLWVLFGFPECNEMMEGLYQICFSIETKKEPMFQFLIFCIMLTEKGNGVCWKFVSKLKVVLVFNEAEVNWAWELRMVQWVNKVKVGRSVESMADCVISKPMKGWGKMYIGKLWRVVSYCWFEAKVWNRPRAEYWGIMICLVPIIQFKIYVELKLTYSCTAKPLILILGCMPTCETAV